MELPDLTNPEAIKQWMQEQQKPEVKQLTPLQKRTRYGKHTERVDELLKSQNWSCYICDADLHEDYYPDITKDTVECQAIFCLRCNHTLGCILALQGNLEAMLKYINHQREASYAASILDF